MKTEEDEAFEAIERRQGGFQAKRAMAADKLQEPEREALKLALEAYLCREMPAGTIIGDPKWWVPKIANAIREALAQPAQEPFGHWHWEQPMIKPLQGRFVKSPSDGKLNGVSGIALYTTSPQRKPLTDEEIGEILKDPNIAEKHQGNWLVLPYAYARAIEAAHGIKE